MTPRQHDSAKLERALPREGRQRCRGRHRGMAASASQQGTSRQGRADGVSSVRCPRVAAAALQGMRRVCGCSYYSLERWERCDGNKKDARNNRNEKGLDRCPAALLEWRWEQREKKVLPASSGPTPVHVRKCTL